MEEMETNYQGSRVRYYVFGGKDLLLNSNDVSAILNSQPKVFTGKYIDLAEAVGASNVNNQTFGEWLLAKFSGYNQDVSLRPNGLP